MNQILAIPLDLRLTALFIFGVCLGSGLNWAIYGLAFDPRSISPWSAPLPAAPRRRWFDRIPVIGWFGLRREAPLHGPAFWVRPLAIELLTGVWLAALYWWEIEKQGLIPTAFRIPVPQGVVPAWLAVQGQFHLEFLAHVVLFALLIVASFIDLDEKTIPDAVTVPGTLLALLLAAMGPHSFLPWMQTIAQLGGRGMFVIQRPELSTWILSSPNEWPWSRELNGMPDPRSLLIGLACIWCWCFALLPRVWRTRHGLGRAWAIFTARLVREPITKWILAMGLLLSVGTAAAWWISGPHWVGLLSALVGLAVGGALIWAVRIVGTLLLGREAMGFGDVTLMAMIGAFLGWQVCPIVFFLAPFAGGAIGITQWLLNRDPEIRFGPFLSLAAIFVVIFWADVWQRTIGLFEMTWLVPGVMVGCLLFMVPLLVVVRFIGDRLRGA